ncbi:Pre-mRNA-splicing factor SPF27-like protein, partial [Cucurbita argyrosperma subsp. argyrosperma]
MYMSFLNVVSKKLHLTNLTIYDCYLYCLVTVRLQQLAQEQNEKMEKVNRERKFHQQNAASELHVLSTQWKELCQKNIEIRVVSSQIEDQIQDRRREAEKK